VPLASTFMLSTKAGKEAYVEPVIEGCGYRFTVKVGKPKDAEGAKNGTKLSRGRISVPDVWRTDFRRLHQSRR
jgi:putative DNA methylase